MEQRFGVGLLLRHIHGLHHPLVAGGLDIPAEQPIGRPHQGLPQLVAPPQMGVFVGDDVGHLPLVHAAGQIDSGPQHTQQERGRHRVAYPDIVPQAHGLPHTEPQPDGAGDAVQQQRAAHRQPDGHIGREIAGHGIPRRTFAVRYAVRGSRCRFRRTDGVHIQLDGGLVAAGVNILEELHLAGGLHGSR